MIASPADLLTGATLPSRIGWKVERMGNYVVFKLDGALNSAILPLTKGQAKSVIREIERALGEMEGRGKPKRSRERAP